MIKSSVDKNRVALISVFAAVFLTSFKIIVGITTGSLGILSEAAHSGLDLIAAIITLFAVRISDRPADRDHHFGHGKVENFSALIETLLLLITCIWIIYEAIDRLFFKTVKIEVNIWSYIVVVISIMIDFSRSRALNRVAKKYNSQALLADALHFQTDIWSSSVVLIGLIFANFDFFIADSIAGIFVAGIVIWISFILGKKTVDALLDKVPIGLEEKIKQQVLKVSEVENCSGLRIRQSGPKIFVDLTVSLKRTLPFEQVHEVLNKIENEILKVVPNLDIIIHPEPIRVPNESILDKVKLITAKYGLSMHEFEKHKLHNLKFSIDLHIESNPDMSFTEVHNLSTQIEKEIYREIPEVEKVIIHIEETAPFIEEEIDITEKSSELIDGLREFSLKEDGIKDCFNFSIFEVRNRLNISMDCKVVDTIKIEKVHALITALEEKIKGKFNNIEKITIHPEPLE
jgi:cation diffusion facilitator family transporter